MKLFFCSSEASPFSKSGGLGDVSFFLPKALLKLGHEIKIVLPMYAFNYELIAKAKHLGSSNINILGNPKKVDFYLVINDDLEYIFIKNDFYFNRGDMYGYYDEAERFAFFNYAILELPKILNLYPDIIHLNDWQTALVPYLLDEKYRFLSSDYLKIKTLLSIHNLQYQGSFPKEAEAVIGSQNDSTYIHFGSMNFLKAGIMRASAINTVSNTYKDEILNGHFAFTLDGALNYRKEQFFGIINAISYDSYNPKTDDAIYQKYTKASYKSGKSFNKALLQKDLNLDSSLNGPLISYIGRLVSQKGIDLFIVALEDIILYSNANIVLLGSGDKKYENYFNYLHNKYPSRVAVYIGYNEVLARRIYAASDLFMMPSLFEPCGLGQMIAMSYGTIPVVRETGGLKDTVTPYNEFELTGNGFTFSNYHGFEFKDTLYRAINTYNHYQNNFNILIKNSLSKSFDTQRMAKSYQELYKLIMKGY